MSAMTGTVTVRLAGIIPHVTRRSGVHHRIRTIAWPTVPVFGSSAASGPHRVFRSVRVYGDSLLHRKRAFTRTAHLVQRRSYHRTKRGNDPGVPELGGSGL